MKRICGSCGRIVDDDHKCPNRYKVKKKTRANSFRETYDWQEKAKAIKRRDMYLCRVCWHTHNQFNYTDLGVHHIVPLEEDFDKRLDDDNLITLCSKHHAMAERGDIPREELIEMIAK